MIKMLVFVISIIGFLDLSVAQFVQNGPCNPNIQLLEDFDVSGFLGTWYVTRRFPNPLQNGDCSTMEFAEQNNTLTVYSRAVQNNFLDEIRGSVSLQAGTAKLAITISGSSQSLDFWILPSTNFSNNVLGYACTNISLSSSNVYIWQLSRTTTIGDLIVANMNQSLLSQLGITIDSVPPVDHSPTACHVLPDIPAGQPIVLSGQCNQNISAVPQFNATAFTGVWHEIYTYASSNEIGTCRRAQYQLSGSSVEVINSEVVNQTLRIIRGNASISSSDGSAQLQVTLDVGGISVSSPLWVLDTDYTSYAVSYTCENLANNQKRVNSWILSRSQQLTEAAQEAVDAVIRSEMDLNSRFYVQTNQTDDECFYFPEFVADQPVVFPGQCDLNITGMENFNASRYLGLWHNIESYYATSQRGTCGNARYSFRGDIVNVYNTQVVNQELDSITGTAELVGINGTGNLLVSFPGASNTINTANYIVLDSDYESYAVVYSCSNINNNERRVTAFKLSRTKELSNDSLLAIERAISEIPVVDQKYFVKLNQTEEGCFYYPKPQPGVPVVFPGKCEDNVNVVQNFSLEQFGGAWFEIEAYPIKEKQQRHCVNHNITISSNTTFSVVTSSVNDQFLEVFNSSGTFASSDGSARMTITLPTQEIPFWVLDTDYSNYALAYGCVNMIDDFRLVYSWKLSRNNQLSENNRTTIDNNLANVTVLENKYFEDISQSPEGCFFLPEIPKGDPIIIDGQCSSNINVVPNFNATAYLGNWRLIESYTSEFQNGTCNRANYALGPDNTVVVTNSQVVNETLETATGSATILSNGRLLVSFPGSNRPLEYLILDTDYSSYSLVYSCENIDTSRRRIWSWKLSRSRDLTPNAIENINHIVNSIDVLNNRYYEDLDQSDDGCFYYPTPDPTKPVIFPGQCDPDISVVTNFNASEYMNLWHNIASYPTQFQTGTCNNAFYTLINGTVDVFNTQVINQTLDTINGVARLASEDGSAKLIVNFPTTGGGFTESPYWVLDTDYTSYALVYSCINLDDESRQVTAWTLSRTKQLTDNATAAIDKVASTVPVLDNKYYILRNQSTESCFYYPEPKPGVVVEFPGQCANIQGVQNFNMSLFQGLWHEVEAYPLEQNIGQCVNHDYILTSVNSSNIISTYVNSQELGVSNSTVTFVSAQDSSGNLTITIISGGQEINIPFVVLSTDYNSYALAYSCVNLPNDHQRVFSWKLSRNQQLSYNATLAINNVTAYIDVLDDRYYENINQTDDACFHLPPLVPGVPVEFVGQCDDNITVVQNFIAANYTGRWLLIQSYPAPQQEGSCNDATYSINGTAVDVYNTKVVNQELVTVNGVAVLATDDGSAKLLVTFPGTDNPAPYWVLDTDYTSFSLVYSCQNLQNNRRRVTSWTLSRTAELTPAATARINQVMSQVNVLDNRYFESVNRTDSGCFYFPTPGREPVIFRGRCDDNITVVQNFDAAAYLGTWYDIESYPVRFQLGSCPTATYETSSVGINVYNTEVVAQRLSNITGTGSLSTTDGSAKLMISFPISGSNDVTYSPYWVLDTDYSNFALVYSCVDLDDEYRRVASWKLSRTKTLLQASANRINSVMSSVQVLDQKYYSSRGHSDEDCFFYPENNGGPVVQSGQCDINLNIVNNFNIDLFAGEWYEISRFPSELQEGECVSKTFTVDNQTLQLSKTIVYNETLTTVVGNVTLPQDGRGILSVNLTDGAGAIFATTYQVLDVAYNESALLHNCRNLNGTHKQIYSWKLSRSQNGLSAAAVARIKEVVDNTTELFEDYYDNTEQTDESCFYYPVFDELPSAIELPGPCNTTVRAKSNFNVNNYLGQWYEIASYPQAFQNGECARAQYSAGNNVVNVLNTQVVNRTLDARSATAVVASNDGSGLLEVTFSFGNVTNVVNYYVLETDYTSYSFVYSCQNLDNGKRRVTSWKLSRGKVLPSHAVPIIDNIINNTQGLNPDYYKSTSQSDEDCFYIPQVDKNEAPMFRGQCEVITGMQGFDVQKYLGWWHEIESYPTNSDVGNCISSNLRAVNNQYEITDTNIFNNSAQVNTSTVSISSDGRIWKTLDNGKNVEIWVLDTDYETYSLLYSCENANSEYKQVWSAKHSKSRQLTAAAQQAMAPIIARTETLEPQFYLPIDQTDEACFHYPEQIGMQIILPGQCDLNIPVVQNFTAENYSGTWYQIEKYPQRFENGTCIGARYTLNENTGVVDVLNWQVWNGTLDTIEGNATISSTDGSAKLIVNLPIRGGNDAEPGMVSMELYVLKTDYITYSLVYSCVNIDPFQRAVGAWKLSRTRTLSAEANSEINIYMNTRQELHQPFFETVEQNNDCPEPNSSYIVKSSIIILVICSLLHVLY